MTQKERPESSDPTAEVGAARDAHGLASSDLVLVVADEAEGGLARTLGRRGYVTQVAHDAATATRMLARETGTVVVLAVLPLPRSTASDLLKALREVDGGVPIVMVGRDATVHTAGDALDLGATDYLRDPTGDPAELLSLVGVHAGARRGDRQLRYFRAKDAPRGGGWRSIIGESEPIRRVVEILRQLCSRTSAGAAPTIFFGGETGTGKGFLAKCMHYSGPRRAGPFVDVNCAALPASLIEAELFGHDRGAFTDAKTSRAGLFETADGGTLFLDEIGAVPFDVQAKLLSAIDEKHVRRIGTRRGVPVDVQIVAATHEDLRKKIRDGTFREDLFHRLNVVTLTVPPLRDRGDDILLLAQTFLGDFCREYGMAVRTLDPLAARWILTYPWPGNVRELRNQIERIVLLENGPVVLAEHFQPSNDVPPSVRVARSGHELRVTLPPAGVSFEELEREILRQALARCEGNVSRAARFLSLTRQTLIYRMKKHKLAGDER